MKDKNIRIKLSEEEKAMVEKYAGNMNVTISAYVRYCCILKPPTKAKTKGEKPE